MDPEGLLRETLLRCSEIDSFQLHVRLHRHLRSQVGALKKELTSRLFRMKFGTLKDELHRACASLPPARRRAAACNAARARLCEQASKQEALMAAAAALITLDALHQELLSLSAGQLVVLGAQERHLLLGRPANFIEQRIPHRRLVRGRDAYRAAELPLDLSCRVIDLDQRAILPTHARLRERADAELQQRLQRDALIIGLASPFRLCGFQIQVGPRTNHQGERLFHFQCLDPQHRQAAAEELRVTLDAALEHEIDILCFPELALDREMLLLLKEHLAARQGKRPALVMAGSFHQIRDDIVVNRCLLLDGWGDTVGWQHKIGAYNIPLASMTELPRNLLALFSGADSGVCEDIACDAPPSLNLLECALGRLATPICRDALDDDVFDLLDAADANLLLVPAMTPRLEKFKVRAQQLGDRPRASMLVANNAWLLEQMGFTSEEQAGSAAYAYLPANKLKPTLNEIAPGLRVINICKTLAALKH